MESAMNDDDVIIFVGRYEIHYRRLDGSVYVKTFKSYIR